MATNNQVPELQNMPSNSEIKSTLVDLEKRLNVLEPLVNKAQTAFGGQENLQMQIKDLRNKISNAKAVYGV